MNENFKIKRIVTPKIFENFILNLRNDTLYNFNYFGKITKNSIKSIVKKELERKDKMRFFIIVNNKLVAYGFLTKFTKFTKKLNCTLGVVVEDQWQNKGYGKKLCKNMINYAWDKGYEKIWLTAFLDNPQAIKMYNSLGFQIEGIFIGDEKDNNFLRDVVSMAIFKNDEKQATKRKKIWKSLE